MKKEVLIIDENQGSDGLERFLKNKGCSPAVVGNVDAGLEKIKESEDLEVVLLNVESSGEKGLEVLDILRTEEPDVTVIMIRAGVNTARKAMKAGASNALSKRVDMEYIHSVLAHEFRRLSIRSKRFPLPKIKIPSNEKLVGDTLPMHDLHKKIGTAARGELPVLLEGETGTGKGLVASLIHEESEQESERGKKPFVLVDCGTVPDTLIEGELFGHKKGAYTDAKSTEIGKFEEANGGTIFLDEVGNMSLKLQSSLLTVLQTGKIQPLGGTELREVNVRVICATNQNLRQMVAQKKFRQDLFYRLSPIEITLPPLRERIEDIPLLVKYFLQRIEEERIEKEGEANTKNRRKISGVSENVMRLFQKYDWPGNVRELENCLEGAATNSQGDVILQRDLSEALREFSAAQGLDGSVPQMPSSETPERPTIYKNLLDLPVGVFCQMLADGESHITGSQIAEWWEEFSDEGRARAHEAKIEIDNWWLQWNTDWLAFPKLSADLQAVIDAAISVLKNLQDEEGSKLIADVEPISIKGRTLKESLAEVLTQIVVGHGGNKEKAAKELGISLENLESRLSYTIEDDRNDTSLSTSIQPSRPIELSPSSVIDSVLIEPIKLFVLEPFSQSEWRDKAKGDQIRIIHHDLRVLLKRLGGEHDYIYFGGMTFSQIERNIYRRAVYLYSDRIEAAKALKVDPRTFNRYWPEEKEFPSDHRID